MRRYEITFPSLNWDGYVKPITALIMEPEKVGPTTEAMLFTHGWGNNRLQCEDMMAWACDQCDLVCISTEFRQSGFEPATSRLAAFKSWAPLAMQTAPRSAEDDSSAGRVAEVPCADRVLRIDWSQPTDSPFLFSWSK